MCRKLIYLISFVLVLGLVLTSKASATDPNLVGWWELNEPDGTTAYDSSGNGNDGTLTNGPLWAAGRIGGALNFDGTNDYVGCGNAASLNITRQITLSVWIRPDAAGNGAHQHYLGKGNNAYCIKQSSMNNIEVVIYIGGWKVATFPVDASFNGVWHHLAGTYDGSQIKIYLNGVLKYTTNQTGAIATSADPVRIGTRDGGQWFYNGVIDDARIYNRALSQIEIKKLANPERASIPIPANGSIITQPEVTLQWDAGIAAALHDVYFGENFADVNNATTSTAGIYKGRQGQNYYPTTGTMAVEIGKTYYWRINEVNDPNIWRGEVWSFSVQPLTAYNPSPDDGTKYVDPNADLSWSAGAKAKQHKVYFDTFSPTTTWRATLDVNDTNWAPAEFPLTLAYNTTYYWRIDEVNGSSTWPGDEWQFRTVPFTPITDPNLVGWWKLDDDGGSIALDWSGRHNDGTVIGDQNWVAGHIGGALDLDGFDDCVNCGNPASLNITTQITLAAWVKTDAAGNSAYQSYVTKMVGGENSSYTLRHINTNNVEFLIGTASATFPVSSPFNGIWHHLAGTYDGSALRLYVDGSLQATTANTGAIPTSAYNVNIGRDSIGNRFPYDGAIDDVRIYNRVLTADEIGKTVSPLEAWNPSPANSATGVEPTLNTLTWKPGNRAVKHDVYFSDNSNDVNSATTSSPPTIYKGRQDPNKYDITTELKWGQTYYWRVDEVNNANIWRGSIWRFTVRNYIVVDNFESYTNSDPNIIYKIWKDGVGYSPGNGTGSQVGYRNPDYAERTIVHGAAQSMPVDYNNLKLPYYSEADRTFDTPQNWTASGPYSLKSLTLWFRGYPASVGSFVESPAGTYTITASGANIGDVSPTRGGGFHDEFHFGYKEITAADAEGLVTIIAKVESVGNTGDTVGKAGVMIRDLLDANSINGFMCVRRITGGGYGVAFQYRLGAAGTTTQDVNDTGITLPIWVGLILDAASGHRNLRAYYSRTGTGAINTWTQLGTQQNYPEGTMYLPRTTPPLYAGLAVTPQSTANIRKATFSNVTITAGTMGTWKSRDIGIKSNVASPLYVTLQDSNPSPGTKTVTHPDPYILLQNTWQEWNIALSDFTGVNLTKINKITIGVGNRSAPQQVGIGTIYVDDIRLYIPRCIAGLRAPDFTGTDCVVDYQDLATLTDNWLISEYQVTPPAGWDPNSDPNLEGWYRFEGNLLDSSGNNYTGDPCGNTISYAAGKVGQAISLDGVNDYVAVPRMVQDDFTLTAWIKTATPGAQAGTRAWQGSGLLWSDVAGAANDFILAVLGTKLSFGTGSADQDTTSSGDVVTGQWVHVAVTRTRSSGQVQLFIDGMLDRTAVHSNTGSLNANPEINIGGNTVDLRYYTGLIDDVRIYSRVLSKDEIALLAGKTAPFTQPLSGLLTNPAVNTYNDGTIDLRDYATLADTWLEILLWP